LSICVIDLNKKIHIISYISLLTFCILIFLYLNKPVHVINIGYIAFQNSSHIQRIFVMTDIIIIILHNIEYIVLMYSSSRKKKYYFC